MRRVVAERTILSVLKSSSICFTAFMTSSFLRDFGLLSLLLTTLFITSELLEDNTREYKTNRNGLNSFAS